MNKCNVLSARFPADKFLGRIARFALTSHHRLGSWRSSSLKLWYSLWFSKSSTPPHKKPWKQSQWSSPLVRIPGGKRERGGGLRSGVDIGTKACQRLLIRGHSYHRYYHRRQHRHQHCSWSSDIIIVIFVVVINIYIFQSSLILSIPAQTLATCVRQLTHGSSPARGSLPRANMPESVSANLHIRALLLFSWHIGALPGSSSFKLLLGTCA